MSENNFKIGQEWSYHTRKEEPNSSFIVVSIDSLGSDDHIIHIFVKNLKMKNRLSPTGFNDHIVHLPCSETSLLHSGIHLKEENVPVPNYTEGYNTWLEAFQAKKAGIFHAPLHEIIQNLENLFNR